MESFARVGGRRLAYQISGSGGPTVVFLPGAGLVGLDFRNLQQRLPVTSVLYDRAGTGWSDPAPLPRTATEVAQELRELLSAVGEEGHHEQGPYVLVGHSLGAMYARRFAQLHPSATAGLVLLDPGYEEAESFQSPAVMEIFDAMKEQAATMPSPTPAQLEASREPLRQLYAEWPSDLRERLVDHHLVAWRTGIEESANFETTVYGELRTGGSLPDVPLTVVTALGPNPYWAQVMSGEQMRAVLDGVRAGHAALAATVPDGSQVILENASHQTLQVRYPDEIVAVVEDLLGRVRARLSSSA